MTVLYFVILQLASMKYLHNVLSVEKTVLSQAVQFNKNGLNTCGNAKTSQLLQSHNTSNSDQTVTDSIHSSEAWKTWYCSSGQFKGDSRALSFAVCMDGLNPFAIEKNAYSMWPMFLIPFNLPYHIRMTFTSMMLMGLIPGPTEPKNTDPYIDVFVAILDVNEMTMCDAYKDEMFRLKANVVLHIFGYPGQNKILNCLGMHTNCGCVYRKSSKLHPLRANTLLPL